jgi:hypothetical protein
LPGVTWPSGFGASSSIVASEAAVLGRKALPLFTECWTPATVARGLSIAAVFVDFVLAKLALVLVVLAVVDPAQARLQLLYRGGCHVKRRRPRRAPCPMVLALLAAALFLLRRRVPILRGTHLFPAGYPALRRGGATVVGFRRGRTQRTRARPAERHHDTRRADARPYPTWTSRLSPEACSRSPSSRIYLLGGLP